MSTHTTALWNLYAGPHLTLSKSQHTFSLLQVQGLVLASSTASPGCLSDLSSSQSTLPYHASKTQTHPTTRLLNVMILWLPVALPRKCGAWTALPLCLKQSSFKLLLSQSFTYNESIMTHKHEKYIKEAHSSAG